MLAKRSPESSARKKRSSFVLPLWLRWVIPAVLLIIAVLVLAFAPARTKTAQPDKASSSPLPAVISVNRAYVMYRDENAFLLDVRSPQEFEIAHIPPSGSNHVVNIPLEELFSRLDEIPSDRDIVVICASGRRSEQARDILIKAGFPRVTSVSGGMQAWIENNLPVEGTFPN
jgi:rhodanese-related sulfurtransferase